MRKFMALVLMVVVMAYISPTVQALGVDDFTISSYRADMKLGRDNENRSTLAVTEVVVAEFPNYDQNHGLERAFVKKYDGHSLSFELKGVVNDRGIPLPYRWSGDNLRIGDADAFVHGTQTYIITYAMRDVTKRFTDTTSDEFYWDVVGTDWRVPISSATVRLTLDESLTAHLTGKTACYTGVSGSDSLCNLEKYSDGFIVETGSLIAGEGVTIAVGFAQDTFAKYQKSFWEYMVEVWSAVQFIINPLAVGFVGWFIIKWRRRLSRQKEIGTIVAEYLPPKTASVTTSSLIYGAMGTKILTAQMLDLAVRHYIRIHEVKAKKRFSLAEYELEIIKNVSDLRTEEQEVLRDMFGGFPEVGARLNLKDLKNNTAYYKRTLNNNSDLDKLIRGQYALKEHDEETKSWSKKKALHALIVAVLFFSFVWLFVAIVLSALSAVCWRLSDKGLVLKRYLEGLKLYIGVAEVERIKMLQSPEGAMKIRGVADGTDSTQLIKLYERVLPYAVLFDQEKEWNKQLGQYYETANVSPDWYQGQSAFNTAGFLSAVTNFSGSTASASSYSSSSGGSSGGGFSGGGGGGGGGGGW